jgi:hypothetical protein
MAKRTLLPTLEQLEKLLERLLPPNEEIDEVSASIILERAGVDTSILADDLIRRLERRIKELQLRSEDVSPNLLEVISSLKSLTP